MCLAILGQLKEFTADQAGVAVVDVGDWVLIHVGFAMSKISEAQAQEQVEILSMLGELDDAMEEVHAYAN